MNANRSQQVSPVALVTGGARRIGASIVRALHQSGYRVVIHYRSSEAEAVTLADELNRDRPDSAVTVVGDLCRDPLEPLVDAALLAWGQLDLLVNNASDFYPTPLGQISKDDWEQLMGSNARAPLFLAQAAAGALARQCGSIVNVVDVHAEKPLAQHPVYCMAKAALRMLTLSLARDLGPEVRVNGVAPGAILWPESGVSQEEKDTLLEAIPLKRRGAPEDIASAVVYLAGQAHYVTGQILSVDGGRSLIQT